MFAATVAAAGAGAMAGAVAFASAGGEAGAVMRGGTSACSVEIDMAAVGAVPGGPVSNTAGSTARLVGWVVDVIVTPSNSALSADKNIIQRSIKRHNETVNDIQ